MNRKNYIKFSGLLLLFAGTFIISLAFFLPHILDMNSYQSEITKALQVALNRKVSFKSGHFKWNILPTVELNEIVIKDLDGNSNLITAEKLLVSLSILPLFEKNVVLRDISLESAHISLIRYSNGKLNINDLLQPGKESVTVTLKKVHLSKSSFHWRDMAVLSGGILVIAQNIDLTLDSLARGGKGNIKLSCDIPAASGNQAHVSVNSSIKIPPKGKPLSDIELNGNIDIKQAEPGRFWPYYGRFIPFENCGGRIDIASSFKGKLTDFESKGKIRINSAKMVWPTVFHATVAPEYLQVEYEMKLTPKLIDIKSADISTNGFRVIGSFQMQDYTGKDPRLIAKAHTPDKFSYEKIRNYIPFGIIPEVACDYIENRVKSGNFKLNNGLLDGKISQIVHMDIGTNYNSLMIQGEMDNATFSYTPEIPFFSNLAGNIELKGKNFNLTGITGLLGKSPFKMSASITDYNTGKQQEFPLHMETNPSSEEIAWLSQFIGAEELEYSGDSKLVLTGSGSIKSYQITGEWDLKQVAYDFNDIVDKPAGVENRLNFSSIISSGELRLTSVLYNLASMSLSARALFKFGETLNMAFEVESNTFMLNEDLPILAILEQYQPAGKTYIHIRGKGNPKELAKMNFSGNIRLDNFSFLPDPKLKLVSNISGAIYLRDNRVETSDISAHYGSSYLNIKGMLKNLQNPEIEASISSPTFFLRDLNLLPQSSVVNIQNMNARIAIANSKYSVNHFSGILNRSNFNVNGVYTSGTEAKADFNAHLANLDINELLLLNKQYQQANTGATKASSTASEFGNLALILRLSADKGKYEKFEFTELQSELSQKNGTVYLEKLAANTLGGSISAKGRIGNSGNEKTRYDLAFDIQKVDVDSLLNVLEISKEVTGTLTLGGNLTAKGATLKELEKSALGNIKLRLNKGSLHKFSTLSKIFSILNVSQLLTLKLPEMVRNGTPYKYITGSFAVHDGMAETNDLFINSEAMNISVAGSTNFVKEELDFTVGVQPLQSFDKLFSSIPLLGWVLTGPDKSFLNVFFEAKGKWSDPEVAPIQTKSMADGALNIFKRLLLLPIKLFTDTGEVLLRQ